MSPTRRARSRSLLPVAWIAALLVVGGVLATPAVAQVPTGTILGHVQDSSGARVPGVQVTATNLGTQYSRSTTTDAEGQYALRLLPLGSYKLEVTLTGFKTFSQTGILVEVGRNARIDATLEAGGIEEVVSVEADASLVETSSSALARTVGQKEVLNLPLVNRDVYSLRDVYGGQGHIFADIQADPRFLEEPGQLDLVYNVKEGGVWRASRVNVRIEGEHPHTRESVVLNRVSVRPGDILDTRELRSSERRLKASQLFQNDPMTGESPRVVVHPPELQDPAETVAERPGPRTGPYRGQSPGGSY